MTMQGQVNATTCNFNTLIETQPNLLLPTSSNTAQSVSVFVYIQGQALEGNYCPNMSLSPFQASVKGSYCPNASTVIQCPANYYCKVGQALGSLPALVTPPPIT